MAPKSCNYVTDGTYDVNVIYHHTVGPRMQSFLQDLGEASNLDISIVDPRDEEGLQQKLPGADVLWHVLHPFGARDIERAQNLKLIHKFGVGVNTIDVEQ